MEHFVSEMNRKVPAVKVHFERNKPMELHVVLFNYRVEHGVIHFSVDIFSNSIEQAVKFTKLPSGMHG